MKRILFVMYGEEPHAMRLYGSYGAGNRKAALQAALQKKSMYAVVRKGRLQVSDIYNYTCFMPKNEVMQGNT